MTMLYFLFSSIFTYKITNQSNQFSISLVSSLYFILINFYWCFFEAFSTFKLNYKIYFCKYFKNKPKAKHNFIICKIHWHISVNMFIFSHIKNIFHLNRPRKIKVSFDFRMAKNIYQRRQILYWNNY